MKVIHFLQARGQALSKFAALERVGKWMIKHDSKLP